MVHESRDGVGNRSLIEVSIEYEAEHASSMANAFCCGHIVLVTPAVKNSSASLVANIVNRLCLPSVHNVFMQDMCKTLLVGKAVSKACMPCLCKLRTLAHAVVSVHQAR